MERFSLVRFSLRGDDRNIPIRQVFPARMGSLAGPAVPVEASGIFGGTLRGNARGSIALPVSMDTGTELGADCRMRANVLTGFEAGGALGHKVTGSQNQLLSGEFAVGMGSETAGSKNILLFLELGGRLAANATGVKDIYTSPLMHGALIALSGAITQTTETASITVTLPPGAELRIDSGTYRVTLDGENVLYAQAGDWINISRELLYLNIESATGGQLEGSLIYTERYL